MNGEPVFINSFNKEFNLKSWGICEIAGTEKSIIFCFYLCVDTFCYFLKIFLMSQNEDAVLPTSGHPEES